MVLSPWIASWYLSSSSGFNPRATFSESARWRSSLYTAGIFSGCCASSLMLEAASAVLMIGRCASVTFAPIPKVSCESAVVPTFACGSWTPGTTGASSPTVVVVSEKNTIDTNVSTSGTRFSWVMPNFAKCRERRSRRCSAARLMERPSAYGADHAPGSRRPRRCLPRAGAERDAAVVRTLQPFEHVNDHLVVHPVGREHEHVAILRILLTDRGHLRLEIIERAALDPRDALVEAPTRAVLDLDLVLGDPHHEQEIQHVLLALDLLRLLLALDDGRRKREIEARECCQCRPRVGEQREEHDRRQDVHQRHQVEPAVPDGRLPLLPAEPRPMEVSGRHRRLLPALHAHRVDEPHGELVRALDHLLGARRQPRMRHRERDGDHEAEHRGVQRNRDAARELSRPLRRAHQRHRRERRAQAEDRAEQSEERRDGREHRGGGPPA